MTRSRRVAAWLLLVAALGLAVLGQIYFSERREYLWDGLVFHGLAALCFVLAWRTSRPGEPRATKRRPLHLGDWLRERPVPTALLGAGLFFSLVAALLAHGREQSTASGDVVALWVLGLAAASAAALWPDAWPKLRLIRLGKIRRETWLEAATIAALTLLALVLRAAALDSVPFTLGGDEAWHGLLARRVLSGQLRNPFNMGYMSMPTAFYWPLSWSLWLVGDTVTGLRFPAALVGALTVPALYFFARHLWGPRTGLLAAAFLATYDYHLHFSRLGANNIWDPLFVVLALWALDRGLNTSDRARQARSFILTGLVMGLSFYFYTGARLLPLLVAVYVAFVWLRRGRKVERLGLHLALLVAALLVVAGPMLGYALANPAEWNARINQVGILQSGWLAREPGLTGKSTSQILAEQFLRAAGAFHVFPDRTVWYGAQRPLLGFLPGVFAVLGLAWAAAHWRDRRTFLVLLWFWSVIVTGGMLTESPPSSQRLVIAIPAVALLVTFGLEQSLRLARRLLVLERRWESAALALLVVLVAASSVRFYFVEFSPSRRYGSQNGETATMIGHYLRDLEGDHTAYFFGAPRIYWNFGTMTFLAPRVPGQDVVEPLSAPPDFVDDSRGAVFIFLPERIGELAWVQQAYPGGHVREVHDTAGRLRFTAYEIDP